MMWVPSDVWLRAMRASTRAQPDTIRVPTHVRPHPMWGPERCLAARDAVLGPRPDRATRASTHVRPTRVQAQPDPMRVLDRCPAPHDARPAPCPATHAGLTDVQPDTTRVPSQVAPSTSRRQLSTTRPPVHSNALTSPFRHPQPIDWRHEGCPRRGRGLPFTGARAGARLGGCRWRRAGWLGVSRGCARGWRTAWSALCCGSVTGC